MLITYVLVQNSFLPLTVIFQLIKFETVERQKSYIASNPNFYSFSEA